MPTTLHIRPIDIQNNKEIMDRFVDSLEFDPEPLHAPRKKIPFELTRNGFLVGYAKAIHRYKCRWGQYNDYAFSQKRWEDLFLHWKETRLPVYLVLRTEVDGEVGYVAMEDSSDLIAEVSYKGARGYESRSDPLDWEHMVHIPWDRFMML